VTNCALGLLPQVSWRWSGLPSPFLHKSLLPFLAVTPFPSSIPPPPPTTLAKHFALMYHSRIWDHFPLSYIFFEYAVPFPPTAAPLIPKPPFSRANVSPLPLVPLRVFPPPLLFEKMLSLDSSLDSESYSFLHSGIFVFPPDNIFHVLAEPAFPLFRVPTFFPTHFR